MKEHCSRRAELFPHWKRRRGRDVVGCRPDRSRPPSASAALTRSGRRSTSSRACAVEVRIGVGVPARPSASQISQFLTSATPPLTILRPRSRSHRCHPRGRQRRGGPASPRRRRHERRPVHLPAGRGPPHRRRGSLGRGARRAMLTRAQHDLRRRRQTRPHRRQLLRLRLPRRHTMQQIRRAPLSHAIRTRVGIRQQVQRVGPVRPQGQREGRGRRRCRAVGAHTPDAGDGKHAV